MAAASATRIRKAIRVCIKPIAELLLRAGIGYRDFEEASKLAFTEVAMTKFGVRGRSTNVSRVAAMTGMARKEVSRLKERIASETTGDEVPTSPAGLVLSGWFTDKDFIDEGGHPRVLQFDAGDFTFTSLVGRYAGDVPAGAVRSELRRSGSIEEQADGSLKALRRHFVPEEVMERLVNSVEIMLHGLASTIAYNLTMDQPEQGRIERFVYSDSLKDSAVPEFRIVARKSAKELMEDLDDWLSKRDNRSEFNTDTESALRVGVGVFYYEGPSSKPLKPKV